MRFAGRAAAGGLVIGLLVLLTNTWAQKNGVFDHLDLLVDVRHELMEHYVEQPEAEKMVRSAVEGMVDSLDDPYTNYLPPDQLDAFERSVQGRFSGIGAQVTKENDRLKIITPLEDSPAWNAGITAGDIVLQINGESTRGMSLQQAVDKLTGEAGTDVTIRVRHETGGEEDITVTRQMIDVKTVRGFERGADREFDYVLDEENGIGYARVRQFSEKTAEELSKALNTMKEAEVEGLVLDLRFNSGGLLESAVTVSDMFLKPNQDIVSIKGRTVPERTHESTGQTIFPDIPVLVLANEGSASAAEIVTGALKDNERAFFVGSRTFGKGSVQQVRMLESGQGALKITNAYYYLPSGRNIHRREGDELWGVDPSEGGYISMSRDEIQAMMQLRQERDVLRRQQGEDVAEPSIDPAWIRENREDPQLAGGLKAILGRINNGDWPQVGKSDVDHAVRASRRDELQERQQMLEEELEQVRQQLSELAPGADAETREAPGQGAADQPEQEAEPSQGEPETHGEAGSQSGDGDAQSP